MQSWSAFSARTNHLQLPFENLGIHLDSNSQNGRSFGNVGVHSLTLSYTLRNMKCDSQAHSWPHTFVSPCVGCELKARVTTSPIIVQYV